MLRWIVYREDFNARKIIEYDIFQHGFFAEDIRRNYKKNKKDFEKFKERLKDDLFYWFGSKCEHEIVLVSWPMKRNDRKVDVRDQVMLNYDLFAEYVWKGMGGK